jgi:DNA repair photolyase
MASLPLLPEPDTPRLIGIARLAAEGEHLRDGHNIEYFTLPVRSLLNRCTSARMPFTWTINPYRGCEFACKYCYARYTHEFMEMRDGVDFERKIFVKEHAADLLRQELRHVKTGEQIALGTATDPYQPAERRYEITHAILEEMSLHRGLDIGIVTKSNLITRDVEILQRISEHNRLFVNLTVTTTNVELARILEPRAPRPDLRLEAVKRLVESGVHAGVICAPVVPGITDAPKDLDSLVQATAAVRGEYIYANPLFLKPCSAAVFLPFLESQFPQLVERYRQQFGENGFLPPAYGKRLSELMSKLRKKHSIGDTYRRYSRRSHPLPQEEEQMKLF